jgi:tetratricopeptide (TPR) repeat protein
MGNLDEAQKVLDEARDSITKHGFKNLHAENSKIYAEYYLTMNKYDETQSYIDEAIKIAEQIGDHEILAESYIIAGRRFTEVDDMPNAHKAFEKCENIAGPIHNEFLCGKCLFHKGETLKKKGDLEGAKLHLSQAKEIFEHLGAQYHLQLVNKIL